MTQPPAAREVRALVFDVFGTVVDWRSGVIRNVSAVAGRHGIAVDAPAFADAWRAGYRPAMQRAVQPGADGQAAWVHIDALHREILETLLPRFGLAHLDEGARAELNLAWHRLDPWPDVLAGLRRLKTKYTIATLSNGNVSLLVDMAKRARLPWDCVLSAELFRRYKPDREVYLGAARLLGLRPDQLLMVAAHPSDLAAAARAGLPTAYVPRPLEFGAGSELQDPPGEQAFDFVAAGFGALASQLDA